MEDKVDYPSVGNERRVDQKPINMLERSPLRTILTTRSSNEEVEEVVFSPFLPLIRPGTISLYRCFFDPMSDKCSLLTQIIF